MERMRNQEKVRENVKKWRKENREKYNEYVRNYWREKRRRLKELEEENKKLKEENEKLKEKRIFSLREYDYMILTSTTPQLEIIKKNQNYSLMEEDTLQELRDIGEI